MKAIPGSDSTVSRGGSPPCFASRAQRHAVTSRVAQETGLIAPETEGLKAGAVRTPPGRHLSCGTRVCLEKQAACPSRVDSEGEIMMVRSPLSGALSGSQVADLLPRSPYPFFSQGTS